MEGLAHVAKLSFENCGRIDLSRSVVDLWEGHFQY